MSTVVEAGESSLGLKYSIPLRLSIALAAIMLAAFLPYFLQFWGLLSALLGVPVGIFIPVVMYWALNRSDGPPASAQIWLLMKHGVFVLLGLVAFIFGTKGAASDLIK